MSRIGSLVIDEMERTGTESIYELTEALAFEQDDRMQFEKYMQSPEGRADFVEMETAGFTDNELKAELTRRGVL